MDTRWSACHMVLLTLTALCNSQQVSHSQSFVPDICFNRSPQQTQTLRQQNNPFSGGEFSRAQNPLRTAVAQPRRPTIRKPISGLPTKTSLSPPRNDQQHVLFAFNRPEQARNQNEQTFGREFPVTQATVQFDPQGIQNPQRQNPTTPGTTQALPKQTFQTIQIPSTLKSQSPTQAQLRFQSQQSRLQIPQQSQPQFTVQRRDQDFKPSQKDNVPTLPQSQRGFQGVLPTSQQLPRPTQIQQPFPTLPPPTQLSLEAPQQEQGHRFRAPQQQTFQQPSQDFSTTEQPKQIFQVITNTPQQQNIDQQRFTQPQSSFVSRGNGLKQQQMEEGSRVNQQLTRRRSQQARKIPKLNEPNEAAEIRHRFELAQRQQQRLETSSKQSNVNTGERNQSNLENPSKKLKDERTAQEKEDEFKQQEENSKYSFSSSVNDSINDNQFSREETSDGKKVSGSYSYSDGFVMRTVQYEADENGYRIVKETSKPIGEGPLEDLDGRADITTSFRGNDVSYSITANDVPHLAKLRDDHTSFNRNNLH